MEHDVRLLDEIIEGDPQYMTNNVEGADVGG